MGAKSTNGQLFVLANCIGALSIDAVPSRERFEAPPADYRREVLGSAPRVAVEAAGKFGWTRYVASEDDMIGMDGFGASAPAELLYERFGITAEAVARRAAALVASRVDA